MHRLKMRLARVASHHLTSLEVIIVLIASFVLSTTQVNALPRLLDRSVRIGTSLPGATTTYDFTFSFRSAPAVGSFELLFCKNPIPYMACEAPAGLDVSSATLVTQSGETGFTILQRTGNRILLSRPVAPVGDTPSRLLFSGIVNPSDTSRSFAVRLANFASTNGTGAAINPSSVMAQVTNAVRIESQVPPILVFCMSEQVTADCTTVGENRYTDMGTLSSTDTLRATSQMGVGTNASQGFAITVNGTTMQSGNSEITPLTTPTPSQPGRLQFGMNLRANDNPALGSDPDGDSPNANPTPNYNTPDRFMFKDGDVIASAPNVSLIRRFTVTYIANSNDTLRAGVYSTTLTYICSGRF